MGAIWLALIANLFMNGAGNAKPRAPSYDGWVRRSTYNNNRISVRVCVCVYRRLCVFYRRRERTQIPASVKISNQNQSPLSGASIKYFYINNCNLR